MLPLCYQRNRYSENGVSSACSLTPAYPAILADPLVITLRGASGYLPEHITAKALAYAAGAGLHRTRCRNDKDKSVGGTA